MKDRAHQLADRAQARTDSQERREPAWRRGTGEPMTEADERALSAGQDEAYRLGRSGRGR